MSTAYYYPDADSPRPLNNNNWPLVWTIIGILLFLQWSNGGWPFDQKYSPRPDDQQQSVVDPKDDPAPQSDKPNIKDTYVVRVFETQASDNPKWLVNQIQDDQFWLKWLVAEQGADLHTRDPMLGDNPNPQALSFVRAAKEKNIDPPFWMHVKKGGDVLTITPFSESVGREDWKRIILEKVK